MFSLINVYKCPFRLCLYKDALKYQLSPRENGGNFFTPREMK